MALSWMLLSSRDMAVLESLSKVSSGSLVLWCWPLAAPLRDDMVVLDIL